MGLHLVSFVLCHIYHSLNLEANIRPAVVWDGLTSPRRSRKPTVSPTRLARPTVETKADSSPNPEPAAAPRRPIPGFHTDSKRKDDPGIPRQSVWRIVRRLFDLRDPLRPDVCPEVGDRESQPNWVRTHNHCHPTQSMRKCAANTAANSERIQSVVNSMIVHKTSNHANSGLLPLSDERPGRPSAIPPHDYSLDASLVRLS